MILVDSSIWVDHLRSEDSTLASLLNANEVMCHPLIEGEILMGNARHWSALREMLSLLPQGPLAENDEVLDLVARHKLHGIGIGFIDAHLLASAQLSGEAKIWSRDRRLAQTARKLGLASLSLPSLQ